MVGAVGCPKVIFHQATEREWVFHGTNSWWIGASMSTSSSASAVASATTSIHPTAATASIIIVVTPSLMESHSPFIAWMICRIGRIVQSLGADYEQIRSPVAIEIAPQDRSECSWFLFHHVFTSCQCIMHPCIHASGLQSSTTRPSLQPVRACWPPWQERKKLPRLEVGIWLHFAGLRLQGAKPAKLACRTRMAELTWSDCSRTCSCDSSSLHHSFTQDVIKSSHGSCFFVYATLSMPGCSVPRHPTTWVWVDSHLSSSCREDSQVATFFTTSLECDEHCCCSTIGAWGHVAWCI